MEESISVFTHFITFISTMSGAFFGAAAAFMFESIRAKKRQENAEYSTLLHTQYIMASHYNGLLNIKVQYLDEMRDNENRFMNLVPFYVPPTLMDLPLKDLAFITEKAEACLIQDIHLTYNHYQVAMEALSARNDYQQKEMYGNETEIKSFEFCTGKAEVSFPATKARILKAHTDCLYDSVDMAIDEHRERIDEIGMLIKRLFPKRKKLAVRDINKDEG